MSTIPFSLIANVIPSVLTAGGEAIDLNGLLLSQSTYAPYGQVLQFPNQAAVASYFGANSIEAQLATNYFSGYTGATAAPGNLLITLYPEAATAGFLRSASLASMTLAQLQALSGTLILTVAGTQFTSSTITLSGDSSFSAAAATIQAAFTSPTFTVVFDSTTNAFIFTTSTTGTTETITFATGTLATGLSLTQATGAVLSQGAALATPAAFMPMITGLYNNYATFGTTWESILTEKEAFATWSNSVQPRFLYCPCDSDVNILTPNNTVTFGNYLQTNKLIGTCPTYGTVNHAAFAMGYAASLNFEALNGRATLAFRSQSGLTPYVSSASAYKAALNNGYNSYGIWGANNPVNNTNFMSPGLVSGVWAWADSYLNQIWLNANLQLAIVELQTSVGSIPYTPQGYSLVYSALLAPINAAIDFGAIRVGGTFSSSQIQEMTLALGVNPAATISATGFYLQIGAASPTTRIARGSPPCTLYYFDGQSIQQINLASIEVQ